MANQPPRRCAAPGCAAVVNPPAKRCPRHAADPERSRSGSNRAKYHSGLNYFYSSKRWRLLRLRQLRSQPICEGYPGGCMELATVVDHIVPISEGGAKLDPKNLQSLCVVCHGRKTADEQRSIGRGGANPSTGKVVLPSVQLKKCGRKLGGSVFANGRKSPILADDALKAAKMRLLGRVASDSAGWKGGDSHG